MDASANDIKGSNMRVTWTPQLDEYLRRVYPHEKNDRLLKEIGCTNSALISRVSFIGVKKSSAYMRAAVERRAAAQRGRIGWNRGNHDLVEKTCEQCGKTYSIWPSREKNTISRFCSNACQHEQKRSITGTDHPLYTSVMVRCQWCGEEFKVKSTHYKNPDRGKFCSRRCVGHYTTKLQGGRRSSIEITIEGVLNQLGIRYAAQHKIGRWSCDFFIPSGNIVLECDGDYWHQRPEVKRRDKRKDKFLKEQGYTVLRMAECDIVENPFKALKSALVK